MHGQQIEETYACQLEHFSGQVLEDCSDVNGSFGADTHLVLGVGLEETLDTAARELETKNVSRMESSEGSMTRCEARL